VTHERQQLVAEVKAGDGGRGPRGASDLDVPGTSVGVVDRVRGDPAPQKVDDHVVAAGRRGGQPGVDGLLIREVGNRVGAEVGGSREILSAGGPDDQAGAEDTSRLHCQLARRAARPQHQHGLTGLEVSTVVEREPPGQAGYAERGGQRGVKAGRDREAVRIPDRYQLSQGAVRRWRRGHVPAGAVGELYDSLVAGDAGGL
jgi:hypothetical protein